ncbi:MAG: MarR family transcriptional regulator [Rhodospirillales bacterium]
MPEAAVPGASLLFLREEHIRQAQDMFFLAWRDLASSADPVLTAHGLGRAHHRALHFIGRHPGLTVTDLLSTLCVTKQSLSRVMAPLIAKGLVVAVPGRGDRRQRLLHLSESGAALERELFERQRERLVVAYRDAGGPAVEGFRRVMRGVMGSAARKTLDEAQVPRGPRVV